MFGASLYPVWMRVKPRPTTAAQPLLDTPLEPLSGWMAFVLLYIPDMVLLFASGLFAGFCVSRNRLRWLTTCICVYGILSAVIVRSIWEDAFLGVFHLNAGNLPYCILCLLIASAAYAGALIASCFKSPRYPCGCCSKCGYLLYGLPSPVCPECGSPFLLSEVGDGQAEARERLSVEGEHSLLRCSWIARRALFARALISTLLVGVFYAWNWIPLRVAQRDVIEWSLRRTEYAPAAVLHDGAPAIRVADEYYFFTAECTYLDLVMIVVPFLWVFGASRRSNVLRITIAALAILGGNLVRSWAAVYFNVRGTDWFYTHDLPDYLIWWPTVAIVVVLALRRDRRYESLGGIGSQTDSTGLRASHVDPASR
jgi:hypothetical protein